MELKYIYRRRVSKLPQFIPHKSELDCVSHSIHTPRYPPTTTTTPTTLYCTFYICALHIYYGHFVFYHFKWQMHRAYYSKSQRTKLKHIASKCYSIIKCGAFPTLYCVLFEKTKRKKNWKRKSSVCIIQNVDRYRWRLYTKLSSQVRWLFHLKLTFSSVYFSWKWEFKMLSTWML